MRHFFFAIFLSASISGAFAQAPTAGAAVNAASFASPSLPNGAIAQGSVFTIFGTNIGPATAVTAGSFPLSTTLGGTSVKVTSGGMTLDCPMVVASSGQTSAILPSNTPVGAGTLTITTAGGETTLAVEIVAHSPGLFALSTAGTGPTVLTSASYAVNTLVTSAHSGESWDIWATGVGAITASDAGAPPVGDLPYDVQVFVGGKMATVVYKGRSGCCAGLDQIRFIVPEGVEGCYVPVVLVVNGAPSNYTTMSIAASGEVCTDTGSGLTPALITQAQQSGNLTIGEINLSRLKISISALGQTFVQNLDSASANYVSFTFNELIRRQGSLLASTDGACSVFQFSGDSAEVDDPIKGTGKDAGPQGTLTGPGGQQILEKESVGSYFKAGGLDLGGFGLILNEYGKAADSVRKGQLGSSGFLGQGDYTVSLPGGADVAAHSAGITVPAPTTWTKPQSGVVPRSSPFTVQFSGGAPGATLQIFGYSAYDLTDDGTSGALFMCRTSASAGSFAIPTWVLQALPPSASIEGVPTGVLGVGSFTFGTFTAGGIDQGVISQGDVDLATVNYQ